MLEVQDLVKKYGGHTAVDGLSFTVEKGQIYGFLGPNGAGKSTTMNIITGYLGATSGKVKINGYDILEEPEKAKKSIGYLPEIPPLYVDMTPAEYLMFAAELKKIEKGKRAEYIEEAMEITGIAQVSTRLIKNLSKGYRQRVGLAQAILGYPELIILDEPTVGLDPKQIIEIRDLIKELSKKHTVILSSHILSEVSAICDHVLIISGGHLAASDSPDGLSKLMTASGNSFMDLEVKGQEETLCRILDTFDEIEEIQVTGVKDEILSMRLEIKADEDIREELFYRLAEENCPIYMLKTESPSLEDVFLELTSENQETAGDADAQEEEEETDDEIEDFEEDEDDSNL